jgi:hypothetical protein
MQKKTFAMRVRFPLAGVALALTLSTPVAFAQWAWMDADGRKVFSDRPPPSDVPDARILTSPASKSGGAALGKPTPPPSSPDPSASGSPKPDAAAKQLEEKKKQAEEAEKAKEKLEQQQAAKVKAENCARAKTGLANLETGAPLRSMNSKGERVFMDETARNQEKIRLQQAVKNFCSR